MTEEALEKITISLLLLPFLMAWAWIGVRHWVWEKPVLPRLVPARPAKWGALAVCCIFFMFLLLPGCFVLIFASQPGVERVAPPHPTVERGTEYAEMPTPEEAPPAMNAPAEPDDAKTPAPHPLTVFLLEKPSAMKFVFAFFVAALFIPFVEEFVFRVIIQGWLERQERRGFGVSRHNGWRAMILAAAFFAAMHIRGADSAYPPAERLGSIFSCMVVAYTLLLTVSIVMLRDFCRVTWRDLGLDFRHWRKDLLLGCLGFGIAAFPAYLLMWLVTTYCGKLGIVGDPVALVPLALALGLLYWRTHRILPCFVTHFLFNSLGVLLSLLYTWVA